jgi:glycosyltransferase involved in cell wall biosynthesis
MIEITVIVCTHNPRAEYLRRVLDGLKAQTFPKDRWEFLLIDNASKTPLASTWDLSWHPQGRHVREEELGLTPARLRGIKETAGQHIVFVDDDNILDKEFLSNSARIAAEYPFLGAWGGKIEGEFEEPAPEWLKPYLHHLAIRDVDRDAWANYYADNRSMPFGAGMCVRKSVADAYVKALASRPASKKLGRTGAALLSGEDIDLAMTAFDNGMGTGLFQKLRTIHLIPKTRMTVEYMARLLEGTEYSIHLLRSQRNPRYTPPEDPKVLSILKSYQVWRLPEPIKSLAKAEKRGRSKARAAIAAQT